MAGYIKVSVASLENIESRMRQENDEYSRLYHALLGKVDEMDRYWQGKDQQAFRDQIHGFEDDFEKLHVLLDDYCDFVHKAAQSYRQVQDETTSRSRRLVQ